jgi:DNA modification methylase
MTAPKVVMPSQIVMRATASLIGYARNSRTHDERQIDVLCKSITEYGFTNPILIDGDRGVIAGHGRIMAAEKLGLVEVPCIELRHLTNEQKRAYLILDNQSALMSTWSEALLAQELADLSGVGIEATDLGFDAEEVDRLMETLGVDFGKSEGDPDAVPEAPVAPTSKLGDVWLLGKHRVMCGDSTDRAQVERLMDGKKAALVHADPPYGMGKEADGVANDNLYGPKLDAFQMAWWRAYRPSVEDNASAYIWGNAPDLWLLWYVGGLQDSERLTMRNEIVWRKPNASGQASDDLRSFAPSGERCIFLMLGAQGFNINADNYWDGWEPIRSYLEGEMRRCDWTTADLNRITGTQMAARWVTRSQWAFITQANYEKLQAAAREHDAFKREHDALKREHDALKRDFYATRAFFDNTHENMTDVWDYDRVSGTERHGHATPKPVPMMERVMRSSLPAGGLCVDPFGGSGSTLMGAEKTGRVCYTMELTPNHVDVIVRRWQDFTGQAATLDGDGRTFAEIAEVRRAAH